MKHLRWFLVCAAYLAFTPIRANAAETKQPSSEQKKAAQKMFEAGDALFESAQYEDAAIAFRQSHTLVGSPNSRLMLARSLRELGKTAEACAEFSGTIQDAKSSGGRYPEALQAATAEFDALKDPAAGCTTQPERDGLAKSPPAASVDGPSPPTSVPAPPIAPRSRDNPLRTFAWTSAGVGVAGLLGFSVFGYLNHQTYRKLDKDCPNGSCNEGLSSQIETGKRYQIAANISLGVAVLGAAAATTLFLVSTPGPTEGSHVSLHVGPGSVLASGSF